MKKLIYIVIVVFLVCAVLQGCGSKDEVTENPYTSPESPDISINTAESMITEEMAYEGVSNYCHSTYDWSIAEDDPSIMYVKTGEETESEYQVIFRSYTGAFVYFYVEKTSGITRIVEYVPTLDTQEETGTINIKDYIGTGHTQQTEQTQPDNNIQDDTAGIVLVPVIQRNVNIYLSNFSEVRMPSFVGHPDVEKMVEFAYDHNYFNNPKSIEYGDYEDPFCLVTDDVKPGEYYGDTYYNHRISYDVIRSTTKQYFNYDLSEKEIKQSNCSDYTDGYYYTLETGGHEPFGFVVAESVEHLGGNEYKVKFHIYNLYKTYGALGLSLTDNIDKYSFSENDLKDLKYTDEYDSTQHSIKDAEGEAIITTSDLYERKQFGIKEYNVVYY